MEEDIKKILVVSWMTKYCQKAVHEGISLARKYGAELFIIHVIHNPFGLEGWNVPMISLEEEYKKLFTMQRRTWTELLPLRKEKGCRSRK